jgi:hypothetical protein
MPTVMPKGDAIKQAIKWISDERREDQKKPILSLVEEACFKFNLSPKDEQSLLNWFRDRGE